MFISIFELLNIQQVMVNYLKIRNGLYLVNQNIKPESQKEKVVDVNTQHIFVIDCSGSMSGELSTIRKDLYNKITTLLKTGDSVTIIWFSSRNEFGVLVEDYTIKGAISFEKLRELINKYLTPVGATAFVQPILEVKKVVERVAKKNPNMLHSMFFLTDGCDNQYSKKEILDAVKNIKDSLNGATFVEYGWYSDRQLLNQMAVEIGGVHTFSENFQDYEPYLTKQFTNEFKGKRKYVELSMTPEFESAFNIQDGDVVTSKPNENNEILINVDSEVDVFYFTSKEPKGGKYIGDASYISKIYLTGEYKKDSIVTGLYAALFAFSRQSDYNMVAEILKTLGDAYLIRTKANTFGTQKITELEGKFLDAINDGEKRFIEGYNPELEPAEDAYCVIDMIEDFMSSDENVFYPQHEAFNYKRIGSKAVAKAGKVSDEDKKKIEQLLSEGKLNELSNAVEEAKANAGTEVKFNYNNPLQACPFRDLVWNEDRANLSVQVKYDGYVNLPKNKFGIPEKFDTHIFRNYTIVKDGIIHTYNLPVSLTQNTFNRLQKEGLLKGEKWEKDKIYVLNYSELPVINRKMVNTLSAENLFRSQYELTKLQAVNYVFTSLKKQMFETSGQKFKEQYGEEGAKWLESLGVKEYGFSPQTTIEKQGEEASVNVLEVKVDKLSSSVTKKDYESAEKKLKESKTSSLTPKEELIVPAIEEFQKFENTLKGTDSKQLIENWLFQKSRHFKDEKRKLMNEISKAKFLTIIGKSWFKEFKSRSENEMTLKIDSKDIKFVVEDKMKTIKI